MSSRPPVATIDFIESAADVAPVGTTRLRRKGGVLQSSTDGGAYVTAGGGATILSRAQAMIPAALFDTVLGPGDFDNDKTWQKGASDTGTTLLSATDKGGVVVLDSTNGAINRFALMFPSGAPSFVDNARTTPWYTYGRIKVGTANANANARMGLCAISAAAPANGGCTIGISGAISATNFAWRVSDAADATVASGTGPALDTNWHDAEIYSDGTTVTFLLDGVSIGTTPATNMLTSAMMTLAAASNGGTAASRTIALDKQYFVCKGN